MCCGLGSAWPGMGRELYDRFPACRAAMDELAALADWDVLGLMDEKDVAEINRSRKQIPYLFLLEYAQWSQFTALGLRPALMSGHSIGELAALCFAGIYSPAAAWHLLDIRAEHMALLEARYEMSGGMLAVSSDMPHVAQVLREFSGLRMANHNSPRQFILSGPADEIMAARKSLRRQHIPAIRLNMNLAFHHPAMRVLRELSMRRLNALEMRPARIPMLSCVTNGLYPDKQEDICRYIADLDENTVEWTGSLAAMRRDFHIGQLLELGPQETLCGLAAENDASLPAIPAGGKGREASAILEACSRLRGQGHIKWLPPAPALIFGSATPAGEIKAAPPVHARELKIVQKILAEITGSDAQSITPGLDLRRELGIRSSRFPYLLQKATLELGQPVQLERLLQVATVADLAAMLAHEDKAETPGPLKESSEPEILPLYAAHPPLERFEFFNAALRPLPYSPNAPGITPQAGDLVALCVFDEECLPAVWSGFAPLRLRLAVPPHLLGRCATLADAKSELLELKCGPDPGPAELADALAGLVAAQGPLGGVLLIPPPAMPAAADPSRTNAWLRQAGACLDKQAWLCCLQRVVPAGEAGLAPDRLAPLFPPDAPLAIVWADSRQNPACDNPFEAGDMLVRELMHGNCPRVVWAQAPARERYCMAAPAFERVWPAQRGLTREIPAYFDGSCQFSAYGEPELAGHGSGSPFSPLNRFPAERPFRNSPWLPVGRLLAAATQPGKILLPQLVPTGFSDIRILSLLALPDGITRECHVASRLQPWLKLEGELTRMARIRLGSRSLLPNGRATDAWAPALSGLALYAAHVPLPRPVWPEAPFPADGEKLDMGRFYDFLAFDARWHFLESVLKLPSQAQPALPRYGARVALDAVIAAGEKSGYAFCFPLLDSVIQAALGAMAFSYLADNNLDSPEPLWSVSAIGYIRHAPIPPRAGANAAIDLRQTWLDDKIARFDAQVTGDDGALLLTAHHLEFAMGPAPGNGSQRATTALAGG